MLFTPKEIKTLSNREFNKRLIRAAEERTKSWKEMMSWPYRYKEEFKDAEWWKESVRYFKNMEERRLKELKTEQSLTFE